MYQNLVGRGLRGLLDRIHHVAHGLIALLLRVVVVERIVAILVS